MSFQTLILTINNAKASQFDHSFILKLFCSPLKSAFGCKPWSYYCELWGISRQDPCLSPSSHWIMIELFKMKCAIPVQILQTLFLWEICTPNHILRLGLNKQSQDISDGLKVIRSLRKLAKCLLTSSSCDHVLFTDVISDGGVTSIRAGTHWLWFV